MLMVYKKGSEEDGSLVEDQVVSVGGRNGGRYSRRFATNHSAPSFRGTGLVWILLFSRHVKPQRPMLSIYFHV